LSVARRLVATVQHRPDPTRSGHPTASNRPCSPNREDGLGLSSALGEGRLGFCEHNQRTVGDSRHETRVSRPSKVPQVPNSSRRFL
jgi:hypothetical protein